MTDDTSEPRPYDHVAGDGDALARGTFRVVGRADESAADGEDDTASVTLLRVADASGRRVHSGELVSVSAAAFASLEPAANPDEASGFTTWGLVLLGGLVVTFGTHPLVLSATGAPEGVVSLVGVALFAVGLVRVFRNRR
ncbi:hypothetical protein [Halogeometricum limi]|uniref:Uncharacterized protein n=1 Tax=Halogeometricum limi TaxID=555875 RepID=A0A1I6I2V7_9EURY|nr:hypothetical protein [Halogeometricum limi]SFR61043.1 hypothetical protein SAMN04488124_2745 [Halogeometricum limi]